MTGTVSIKIGTRGSKLALWQAEWVKARLEENCPQCRAELVVIKTRGDKILDTPLAKIGGKGLFVKEIEEALLDGRIDLAVHSMKDMPGDIPPGLCIGAVPDRETPFDALIASNQTPFPDLPGGARIGTSSLRRASQLLYTRPDLTIVPLRGNIDTRLSKLDSGEMDAVILAAAGLTRLGFGNRITQYMDKTVMLPAVAQGALCIEIRENDLLIQPIVSTLEHRETRIAVTGERAFLRRLEGGCQVPMAAFAEIDGNTVSIEGLVADLDGSRLIRDHVSGNPEAAAELGVELAEKLLSVGAREILDTIMEKTIQ
ncbi:MAG: hydroxymethylbilane synthase [Thermodesulfobacteriota bacterium]|nr:hydroxymethylbilane synthase [Thermodesulfobacteriota bacterium]